MKVIIIEKTGGVENLIYTEMEQPVAGEKELVIEVKAIGINPVDNKVRMIEDVLHRICGEGYPAILGWDVAGVVSSVGPEVTAFKPGDKVFGMINFPGRGNAYAEYVLAPADQLALMPANVSFEEAAATTLAALTALQVLEGKIGKGDRVLIHAGSGGVGHFAIQLAKDMEAYVISTSSAKNKDFILGLGADEHIDYKTQAFEEVVSDVDFVLDLIGGETTLRSLKVLKEGGSIVSLPSPIFSDEIREEAKRKNIDLSNYMVSSSGEDMNTLKECVSEGMLRVHISKSFGFNEMKDAHTEIASGRTVGKVVVTV